MCESHTHNIRLPTPAGDFDRQTTSATFVASVCHRSKLSCTVYTVHKRPIPRRVCVVRADKVTVTGRRRHHLRAVQPAATIIAPTRRPPLPRPPHTSTACALTAHYLFVLACTRRNCAAVVVVVAHIHSISTTLMGYQITDPPIRRRRRVGPTRTARRTTTTTTTNIIRKHTCVFGERNARSTQHT